MSGTVFSTPGATGGAVATPVVDSTGATADLTAAKTPEQIMETLATAPAAVTPPVEVAKTPEQVAAEAAAAAKPVVPEKYEFKAPDGVTFDQAQIDAFSPIAKELGLTNDQAQKLVDFHTATVTNATAAVAQARVAETAKWGEQSAADADFGGVKFKENTGIAVKALDKFGTPALRQALDASGMGNHPEVFRLLWKIGKSISEDTFSSGNGGGGGAPRLSAAKTLFPNLPD
jgi:hypothetical protein